MKRKILFLIYGFFIITLISFHGILAGNGILLTNNPEWKVNIGDSNTYIYEDFYDITKTNPFQFSVSGIIDGEFVSVTVKKGTKLTYTITSKTTNGPIIGKITFNSNITFEERPISDTILRKTVNNKSYLGNYYKNDKSFSIQGDLLIQTTRTFDIYYEGGQAFPYELTSIFKWDWKTGWLTFYHIRSNSYSNELYYEEKFEVVTGEKSTNGQLQSNVIFGTAFLSIIAIILVTETKIIKKDN